MNQQSLIGFGGDITVAAGYAQRGNDRLGNFDLVIENTGANQLTFVLKELTSASGFTAVGAAVTVTPRGVKTLSYSLLSKRVGFFGSGNTTANISTVLRNPADLRGAQIDIVNAGRRGWGFDAGFDTATLTQNWGSAPDSAVSTTPSGGEGATGSSAGVGIKI